MGRSFSNSNSIVLGLDIGSDVPFSCSGNYYSINGSISTIWQKKLSNNLPLSVSNFYQAIWRWFFPCCNNHFFVDPFINFSKTGI